jgi:hypothetical protein
VTKKPSGPSADAGIDELQAWAARSKAASTNTNTPGVGMTDAGAPRTSPPRTGAAHGPSVFSSVSVPARNADPDGQSLRGMLLPKVLVALGLGVVGYLVLSFIIGILMMVLMVLMVLGVAAVVYVAYRIGRQRGRSD